MESRPSPPVLPGAADVLAHAGVLVLRQGGRWLREAGVEAVAEAAGPVLLVS